MDAVLARSQERREAYSTRVLGHDFVVLSEVFSPAYYAETAFYTSLVSHLVSPGSRYLDLGCGVGVTAVITALNGAEVTALDINPQAVRNTQLNAQRHGVASRLSVLLSDVYSALDPGPRFDTIYWNVPFGFRHESTSLSPLEEAIYDPGYRKNRGFILGAKNYLKPGGQLLMGVSSTLGDLPAVHAFAAEAGIHFGQIAEISDPDAPYEIRIQLLRALP